MIYDLTSDFHRKAFLARVDFFMEKGKVVELVERNLRTKSQNNYLHLLIGVVAMETGNTLEDVKTYYFKLECNKDIFQITKVDKMGRTLHTLRSSADLSKEEMSIAIDRFKRWGADNGIYLPDAEDEQTLRSIAFEMERNKAYLGK